MTGFRDRAGQRFFTVDMLARGKRSAANRCVPMIGGGDHHGIHGFLAVEKLAIVSESLGLWNDLQRRIQSIAVDIANRDHVHRIQAGDAIEIDLASATDADLSDLKTSIGRICPGSG